MFTLSNQLILWGRGSFFSEIRVSVLRKHFFNGNRTKEFGFHVIFEHYGVQHIFMAFCIA